MIEAADLREWRTHDVVDPTRHRLVFVPLDGVIVGPGYVKINYATSLVKNCPPTGTDDVLPATSEEAVFQHYGLPYQPGGERQLARR
ncbi:PRC-barrel domain containing protein [Actinacidiphila oryziradicis]|uniref:PRC-barrel domain containing protein n=1 Tax=Actinacidiphila oryziradicis TaxID=2571141 RepID=A0A4U0RDV9_9ACTN|nr:PRC-barrel domain containing protein [Actinacidiphila oryziradicis]TJZ92792.1 PRC-barrel domain containing protein [Actinacidiphila oryziradicis]